MSKSMVHKVGHTSGKLYPAAITLLSWWKKNPTTNKQSKQTKNPNRVVCLLNSNSYGEELKVNK